MNYNVPSDIVKDISFDDSAREKVYMGVKKLSDAVASTLGASGNCVIFEDSTGQPVVTKDGVTVAESVVLEDPIEDIGAKLVKEAAKNTVKEAGDGTTTATVLARNILDESEKARKAGYSVRDIHEGINYGVSKVTQYLDKVKIPVTNESLDHVAAISCNNDMLLGSIISEAYKAVGGDGAVTVERSGTRSTSVDVVDGIQFSSPIKDKLFFTDKDRGVCELEDAYVLMFMSELEKIENIMDVVNYVIEKDKPLLIIANVSDQVYKTIAMNWIKKTAKITFVDPAGFADTKRDTMEDIALLTGARVIDTNLGDASKLIDVEKDLGKVESVVIDDKTTTITVESLPEGLEERIEGVRKLVNEEENEFFKKKLRERVSMLTGTVSVISVGADSEAELKEKLDRVDDAVHSVRAALKEGIVSGGGVALKDASTVLNTSNIGEKVLHDAILSPQRVILKNAGLLEEEKSLLQNILDFFKKGDSVELQEGEGVNAITGEVCNMVDEGIIDPVLVTKTALKNAASVSNTILSAGCVISNARIGR